MHESNNANPYEAPKSPSVTRSRKSLIYIMMIAVVVVVALAAGLVVKGSTKSIHDRMIYMDRGPVPRPVEMPTVSQEIASGSEGEGKSAMLPSAAP